VIPRRKPLVSGRRRTRLRRQSAKARARAEARRECLRVVRERSGGRCECRCSPDCTGRMETGHEPLKRSRGGDCTDPAQVLAACLLCNGWIEDHDEEATRLGLSISRYPGRRRMMKDVVQFHAESLAMQIGIEKATGALTADRVRSEAARFIAMAIAEDRAASEDALRAEITRLRALLIDAMGHVIGNGRRAFSEGAGWESVVIGAAELARRIEAETGEPARNICEPVPAAAPHA
jgi:hypothetical protein